MSMEILNQWADEPVPLVTCESHVFQAWMTTGRGVSYRCVTCGRIALNRDADQDTQLEQRASH